jgi:chromodomain protein Y
MMIHLIRLKELLILNYRRPSENNNNNNNNTTTQEADDDDNSSSGYEVEEISDSRSNNDGTTDYLVKWAGYSSEDNSWKPQENLSGAQSKIKEYNKKFNKQK